MKCLFHKERVCSLQAAERRPLFLWNQIAETLLLRSVPISAPCPAALEIVGGRGALALWAQNVILQEITFTLHRDQQGHGDEVDRLTSQNSSGPPVTGTSREDHVAIAKENSFGNENTPDSHVCAPESMELGPLEAGREKQVGEG